LIKRKEKNLATILSLGPSLVHRALGYVIEGPSLVHKYMHNIFMK